MGNEAQLPVIPTEAMVKQAYANLTFSYADYAPIDVVARKNSKMVSATYLLLNLVKEDQDYNYWKEDFWNGEVADMNHLEGLITALSQEEKLVEKTIDQNDFFALPWHALADHDEIIE